MQFLLDHIAAVVITGIVLLVILATQNAGKQTNIDATQYYDVKTRMLDLVESVERDFNNLGSGIDSVKNAIQSFDTTGTISSIAFFARTDSTNPAAQTVTYQWEEDGSVRLKDETVPTYTISRLINGNVSGSSVGSLTDVRIDLLRADSLSVGANYADTRLINVILHAASTLGRNAQVEESAWRKQFRPVNMTRDQ